MKKGLLAPACSINSRVRLYDDNRLELLIGATAVMTVPRGRPVNGGKHGREVSFHQLILALRRKPIAMHSSIYRGPDKQEKNFSIDCNHPATYPDDALVPSP